MKIIKTRTEVDIKSLNELRGNLKKGFMVKYPFKNFENHARILMSEKTRNALRVEAIYTDLPLPLEFEKIYGIKVLIDDDIPYGECEIFTDALGVCL